jgi:DNA helicase-2/ATP-dependent DNA helicase PcrA
MPKIIEPGSPAAAVVAEEDALLQRVASFLRRHAAHARAVSDHEAELIELRDAIAEAKPEDVAPLVEQMTRVSAVAAGRRGKVSVPVDQQAPYFGHLRLLPTGGRSRDVLIGRRGLIDRQAGVQIVDWRDAPISQLYYRYEEGDDYEEDLGGGHLAGVIEARRNVTIQGGRLRRVGCPQGNFFSDAQSTWWQVEQAALPSLAGGQGQAARAPRPLAPQPAQRDRAKGRGRAQLGGPRADFAERVDKHLPEIAALIDPDQFSLITEPGGGLLMIQGGAGSGKTTVALHRVAYLAFKDPQRFRPRHMLVIVPSDSLARYVSGVLPSLGVNGVPVLTSRAFLRTHRRRLLPHLPDRWSEATPEGVSRLKKHPRMLQVIDAYLRDQERDMGAALRAALQDHGDAARAVLERFEALAAEPLRRRCRKVREAVSRGLLGPGAPQQAVLRAEDVLRRLSRRAHDVGRDWAEILTDPGRLRGLQGEPTDPVSESDIAALVSWCKAQQEEVETLSPDMDEERFQAVDGKPLDEGHPAGCLDEEDDPILLRLYQCKHGAIEGKTGDPILYDHLVLDEAQDLSVIEVKVLLSCLQRGPSGISATIAGDVAQRLVFDNGFHGWEPLLADVGVEGVRMTRLRLLYRSTAQVMALAQEVLGPLRSRETEQQATRAGAEVMAFRFSEVGESVAFLAEALRSLLLREPTASVALIARHAGTADLYHRALARAEVPSLRRVVRHEFPFTPGIDVTDVTQVKGLEFDYVVILDATEAAYPDGLEARHLLHIAITRCAHQLWLICAGAPSPLVPEGYWSHEVGQMDE